MEYPLLMFVSGIGAGILGGFLGLGGGIIIIPLLAVVFGYPIHEAVATSLALVVANSIVTSSKYLKSGIANLQIALFIGLFSAVGSVAGSLISINVSGKVIYTTLGCMQMTTLIFMQLKSRLVKNNGLILTDSVFSGEYHDPAIDKTIRYSMANPAPMGAVAGITGVLSGMVGVGGSVIVVPVMNIISKVPMKAAAATSALVMGFTGVGGGIVFMLGGYTRPDVIAVMVPAIFIGSRLAAMAMNKVKGETVYRIFMVFLFVIACQMLYKGFTSP